MAIRTRYIHNENKFDAFLERISHGASKILNFARWLESHRDRETKRSQKSYDKTFEIISPASVV